MFLVARLVRLFRTSKLIHLVLPKKIIHTFIVMKDPNMFRLCDHFTDKVHSVPAYVSLESMKILISDSTLIRMPTSSTGKPIMFQFYFKIHPLINLSTLM